MGKIDSDFQQRTQLLVEEKSLLDETCSAQEKVLQELRLTREKIRNLRYQYNQIEEDIAQTHLERSKVEQKAAKAKTGSIVESAKQESELKSDFE